MGQVPVRCHGAVSAGDALVPSGRDDGCAISAGDAGAAAARAVASVSAGQPAPPTLGTALQGGGGGGEKGEHLINCLVRWDDPSQRAMTAALSTELAAERSARKAAEDIVRMYADALREKEAPSWTIAKAACNAAVALLPVIVLLLSSHLKDKFGSFGSVRSL